jgi:hypothetical protein
MLISVLYTGIRKINLEFCRDKYKASGAMASNANRSILASHDPSLRSSRRAALSTVSLHLLYLQLFLALLLSYLLSRLSACALFFFDSEERIRRTTSHGFWSGTTNSRKVVIFGCQPRFLTMIDKRSNCSHNY